jgi:hypothetical protein
MIAPKYKGLRPITEAQGSDVPTEGTTILNGSLYTITLNSFQIAGTRSPQNDTDFVSLAVAVGGNAPTILPTKSMGDLTKGTYQVSLSIPNLDVSAADGVLLCHIELRIRQECDRASTQNRSRISREDGGGRKPRGWWGNRRRSRPRNQELGRLHGGRRLIQKIDRIIFENCDGSVAAGDHVYSGAQLAHQTARGQVISATNNNGGTSSPPGCRNDSHYYMVDCHAVKTSSFNLQSKGERREHVEVLVVAAIVVRGRGAGEDCRSSCRVLKLCMVVLHAKTTYIRIRFRSRLTWRLPSGKRCWPACNSRSARGAVVTPERK